MIDEGNPAPDFELEDQDGKPVKLSDLRGAPVVLYFYPKADTPGCTTQACGIRDRKGEYEQAGAVVLGVWVEKSMYGKKYWGNQRATFIIDADGKVGHVIPKASPATHDDEVLGALQELASA